MLIDWDRLRVRTSLESLFGVLSAVRASNLLDAERYSVACVDVLERLWSFVCSAGKPPRLSPKRFSSDDDDDDDDVQNEVLLWMRQQPKEFYAAGIGALIKRWDKCINIGGDYIEK
ncbi:hypothetical protein AVEN_177513-1 [Araneus ventricosus]|uniref:Uncharacterized protein n=1 Tax=Araneus ventricosus TaxID=182803 RepID=A0A4Y2D0L8_ARAVE|nr:hypothetical protein AVEN_177513-1 [Araneus ventricosus]